MRFSCLEARKKLTSSIFCSRSRASRIPPRSPAFAALTQFFIIRLYSLSSILALRQRSHGSGFRIQDPESVEWLALVASSAANTPSRRFQPRHQRARVPPARATHFAVLLIVLASSSGVMPMSLAILMCSSSNCFSGFCQARSSTHEGGKGDQVSFCL